MKEITTPPLLINLLLFIFSLLLGYKPGIVGAEGYSTSYTINLDMNAIVIILLGIGLALSVVGIQVLGSGLSQTSVSIIIRAVIYILTWVIISLYTWSFLNNIAIVGNVIYIILTFLYGIGCFLNLVKSGGGNE